MTLMQLVGWAAILAPTLGIAAILVQLGILIGEVRNQGKRADEDRAAFTDHVRLDREAHEAQQVALAAQRVALAALTQRVSSLGSGNKP